MAPIAILIKFLGPIIAFYYIQKFLRNALSGLNPGHISPKKRSHPADDVIEICPDCGNVKLHHHRCKFNE